MCDQTKALRIVATANSDLLFFMFFISVKHYESHRL